MAFRQRSVTSTPTFTTAHPPPRLEAQTPSSRGDSPAQTFGSVMADATNFDIFDWFPAYQCCQRYFVSRAQYEGPVQAVAALINISLPFQSHAGQPWATSPVGSGSAGFGPSYPRTSQTTPNTGQPPWLPSLVPYIRRLVVTGFDNEGILHGFFGDDWRKGIGPMQECERRNYLFTAKSVGWAKVKYQYDMSPSETVPFLRPLQRVQLAEIESAEKLWSQWLAMEDWMVGPRAPDSMDEGSRDGFKSGGLGDGMGGDVRDGVGRR